MQKIVYSCTTLTLRKSSAAQILPIFLEVIKDMESCNLQVQVVCTDNYPLNVSLFKLLSPTTDLETCVPHPLQPCRPLYLIFDFVHIIKTIRNNWINQIDSNHTFSCPSFLILRLPLICSISGSSKPFYTSAKFCR